jgi:DNA repair protein RadA/Sms
VAFGEVGLLGELRAVGGMERRLREAARLGFDRALVPRTRSEPPSAPGLEVIAVATVRDALAVALDGTGRA